MRTVLERILLTHVVAFLGTLSPPLYPVHQAQLCSGDALQQHALGDQ